MRNSGAKSRGLGWRKAAVAACLVITAMASRLAAAPTAEQGEFELHEFSLLIATPGENANARQNITNTLPTFVSTERAWANGPRLKRPMPGSVIALRGTPSPSVDVLLEIPNSQVFAHWPGAERKPGRLLWKGLTLSTSGKTQNVTADHWFAKLRTGDALFLQTASIAEQFLFYDAEIPCKPQVTLETSGKEYKVANTGNLPLYDVTLLRPSDAGLQSAYVEKLASPATAATQPASPAAATPPLSPPLKVRDEAFAPLAASLAKQGLAANEVDHLINTLKGVTADLKWTVVVYRLERSEIDRLMPLTVIPRPAKTTRVCLVMVWNVDPSIQKSITQLIAQLNDAQWKKREAAQQQLLKLGKLAEAQLKTAASSKDPEIAYRAEQLLESLNQPPAAADTQLDQETID